MPELYKATYPLADDLIAMGNGSTQINLQRQGQILDLLCEAINTEFNNRSFVHVLCDNNGSTLVSSGAGLLMTGRGEFDFSNLHQKEEVIDRVERCCSNIIRDVGADSLRTLSRGGLSYRFQQFNWSNMITELMAGDINTIVVGRDLSKVLMNDRIFKQHFSQNSNSGIRYPNSPCGALQINGIQHRSAIVYCDELGSLVEPNKALVVREGAFSFSTTKVSAAKAGGTTCVQFEKRWKTTIIPSKLSEIEYVP